MSEQLTNTQVTDVEAEIKERKDNIYRSYNYVGTKETIAYLFNDWSNTFNIGGFNTRYIWDVVKIDFGVNAIVNLFTGAWDVINDLLFAGIVDNTRTRIGKFRPYLVMMQIPLSLIGLLYWFLPYFFPNTAGTYVPKLIFYFVFNIITDYLLTCFRTHGIMLGVFDTASVLGHVDRSKFEQSAPKDETCDSKG